MGWERYKVTLGRGSSGKKVILLSLGKNGKEILLLGLFLAMLMYNFYLMRDEFFTKPLW